MTREEIEQAIKNGESVWVVDLKNKIITENKRHKHFKKLLATQREYRIPFNRMFTTRRQAEHYLHHANVERVEKLPFLTWEEFKEIGQISFIGKDKKEYILKKDITWSNNKYTVVDCLKIVNETDFTFSKYFDYTEDNFYKAYDECVRLFRGGK